MSDIDDIKSKAKEAAGKLAGDEDLERDGKTEHAAADLKEKFQEAKESVEDKLEEAGDKLGEAVERVKDKIDEKRESEPG